MAKGLKCWRKVKGHNEWLNKLNNKRVSVSYVLNGQYKGKYDFTLGGKLTERGTRKILLEKHLNNQPQAHKFAKSYMRKHDKC